MAERRYLRKKQLAVLGDMFDGELEEAAVLAKHKVSEAVYSRWLSDEMFCKEFARRISGSRLRIQALLAKYSFMAAVKLVQLTASEKGETARKACLDIISFQNNKGKVKMTGPDIEDVKGAEGESISAATASRILEVLANDG